MFSKAPNTSGKFFTIVSQPYSKQQKDRICVCFDGEYIRLEFGNLGKLKPEFLEVLTITWDEEGQEPLSKKFPRAWICDWPKKSSDFFFGKSVCYFTIKPKTPEISTNDVNRKKDSDSSFFFVIRVMISNGSGGYLTADEITTSTFKTVSHSKMCDIVKRPGARGSKKRRNPRKKNSKKSKEIEWSPIRNTFPNLLE